MAEFQVTLSDLTNAASKMRQFIEDFKNAANELNSATQTLTTSADGWDAESSKIFAENIQEANKWMQQMGAVAEQYAATLDKARQTYQEADETSAKNF
ncbi:MAG: PPE domain-containing protein [Clostridia bacterium]|nr:PPE domain-containing protein [Clostridia bacterium]